MTEVSLAVGQVWARRKDYPQTMHTFDGKPLRRELREQKPDGTWLIWSNGMISNGVEDFRARDRAGGGLIERSDSEMRQWAGDLSSELVDSEATA